jgi:hypothetical protein
VRGNSDREFFERRVDDFCYADCGVVVSGVRPGRKGSLLEGIWVVVCLRVRAGGDDDGRITAAYPILDVESALALADALQSVCRFIEEGRRRELETRVERARQGEEKAVQAVEKMDGRRRFAWARVYALQERAMEDEGTGTGGSSGGTPKG